MDDSPGPSQRRRSSDPLLSSRDPLSKFSRSSQEPVAELHDDLPPPKYSAEPGFAHEDAIHARTREPLLCVAEEDGRPRKMSEDGLELDPGREEVRGASLAQRKALWWKNTFITAIFIASWYGFATLLSLYNKWMFSPQYYNFPFPLFVTFCHMLVQFFLAGMVRLFLAEPFRPPERPTRQAYVAKIMPTAVSTGGDIGLSNLSLKTITLSLYTMCKSSTLIFVLLFAFTFHLEQYSLRLISVISLISFGVFLMVFNTTSVSIPGIIMVFSASALGGLRWALTELVMHKRSMGLSNPFATIFWLAPGMAVTLAIVSIGLEGWFAVLQSAHFQGTKAVMTVGVIIFPGGLAFAMVASEYFIIQRAGVVPMSIAGIFKEVTTISISAWVFGDQLTELNIIGVAITVCGIALYSFHKYQKSIFSDVPLGPDDRNAPSMHHEPIQTAQTRTYARVDSEIEPLRPTDQNTDVVPLESLDSSTTLDRQRHAYPPEETAEEHTIRLRDEFEGWNRNREEWSEEEEEESGLEEVERRRNDRIGTEKTGRSWGEWWEKEM